MLLADPKFLPAMSANPFDDFQPTTSAPLQPTSSKSAVDDLSDTADQLDTVALAAPTPPGHKPTKERVKCATPGTRSAPARKRAQRAEKPALTVDQAIAKGLPAKELDALLKDWTRFTLQEARDKAKAATQAMAKSAEEGRRKIADELLKLADGYGCTMEEAKEIYKDALAAKFDSKVKGK